MNTLNEQEQSEETFTESEVLHAVEQFIEYGEQQCNRSHFGYYSGEGWAGRCIRFHLKQLKAKKGQNKKTL